jgi:hypothetical protein
MGSSAMMCSAAGQHHTTNRDLVKFADGLADDGERVMPDLAVRAQVGDGSDI